MSHQALKFSKHQETEIVEALQTYFSDNLEPITQLQAYLLLDFILKTIGPEIYNLAIEESYAYLQAKLEDLFVLQK